MDKQELIVLAGNALRIPTKEEVKARKEQLDRITFQSIRKLYDAFGFTAHQRIQVLDTLASPLVVVARDVGEVAAKVIVAGVAVNEHHGEISFSLADNVPENPAYIANHGRSLTFQRTETNYDTLESMTTLADFNSSLETVMAAAQDPDLNPWFNFKS